MKTIYNNENEKKHSKMIKDLQNLPKIETPENFEYNLMTRIKNQNFGTVHEEKLPFNWIKFLAPSAVVVTVIILFFVFLPSSQQIENPVINQAQKSDSQAIVNNSLAAGNEIVNQFNSNQKTNAAQIKKDVNGSLASGNKVQSVTPKIPFGTSRSVSLDDYIYGGANQRNLERGNIVNSGNEPAPFDGFFVAEKPDQNTLKKYRAQADSIKKAQMKADSLEKIRKMP